MEKNMKIRKRIFFPHSTFFREKSQNKLKLNVENEIKKNLERGMLEV
jgi:hypothetical protein